ncbi:MAG: hypothetical protein HY951_06465 [Bacteroidia bacterium]|nr:hypothetical protein [Bacteroidia bacterium]
MIVKGILCAILILFSLYIEAQNNTNNNQQISDTTFDVIYTPTGEVLNQTDTIYNVEIKVGKIISLQNISGFKIKIKSLENGNILHDYTVNKTGNNNSNFNFNHINGDAKIEILNVNPIDFDYEVRYIDNNGNSSNSIIRKH